MQLAWVVTGGFDRSGRERVIPTMLTEVERLARRHRVDVYVLRYLPEPTEYELLGATVRDLGRPGNSWRQHAALLRALRQHGPYDVVHAQWIRPAGLVAAGAGRRLHIPALVTCSSGEFASVPGIRYGQQRDLASRAVVAATARLATRLFVPTRYMQAQARAAGYETTYLPLGIDTSRFVPPGQSPPPGPPWRLVHVASLNRVKDQPTLLRAMAGLRARGVDAHLDVVGEDTLGGEVQRLAAELQIQDRVTFRGALPIDGVIAGYQAAHALVMSSRHEGAGAVVLEAAACGVPTVGTAVGCIDDLAPEMAVAVPCGDHEALATAVANLLMDDRRRRHMGGAARAWVLAHDANWWSAQMDRLYEAARFPAGASTMSDMDAGAAG